MIVACDLDRDDKGNVIVGPETRIACDRALELARMDKTALVVATAGEAGREWTSGKTWNNVWMASVMMRYLRQNGLPAGRMEIGKARTFTTDGEMTALAGFIQAKTSGRDYRILLAVKWWHAPRSWALCTYRLTRAGLNVPVNISWCRSRASIVTILKEFVLAWPKNILRIVFKG